jgi:ubiquinone/menaquinone biosynthesis C-methylase UbiE
MEIKAKIHSFLYRLFDILLSFGGKQNPKKVLTSCIANQSVNILEIGTGTADTAINVAKVNDQNKIMAIDVEQGIINVAANKIKKQNLSNVSVCPMDAKNISFSEQSFDIVIIAFCLHELKYAATINILQESARVLKDGGKLYIVDYKQMQGLFKNILFHIYLFLFEPKYVFKFFKYDWNAILNSVGLNIDDVKTAFMSRILIAVK